MSADWRSGEPQIYPMNHAKITGADERISTHPAVNWRFPYSAGNRLVESFAGGMLQPLDLILDHQLAALQLDNLQVVCGKVHERFVQFIFEDLVFTFKFNKMRL
jgi:hypothetical protein